jgi:serine protease Do
MDRSDSSFPSEEPFEDRDETFEDLAGYGGGTGAEFGPPGGIPEGLIGDDTVLRGWIPQDDRLWLHPSEIGREARVEALDQARRRARRSDRRGLLAASVVGTAALTAAVAAVALAATSSNPIGTASPLDSTPTHLTSSDTSGVEQTVRKATAEDCSPAWLSSEACNAIARVQPSMFQIVVGKGTGAVDGTAVVVSSGSPTAGSAEALPDDGASAGAASGTVAITAASLVGKAKTVQAINAAGREEILKVLGVDEASGVAVVSVPWSMPAAPLAQQPVMPGQNMLVLACIGPSHEVVAPEMGEVKGFDTDDSPLMDAFEVGNLLVATPGGVLLDTAGSVLGVLGATERSSSNVTGEFIPSWLAMGVAKKLATGHRIVHGWLDLKGMNGAGGAVVVPVPADGPAAAAGLRPGDLVVGLSTSHGAYPIDSMADLRGRLYLEPPGTKVELDVLRGGQELTISSVLASYVAY